MSDEIRELVEDTLNLYRRYKGKIPSQNAASRVIEDLRDEFFEDPFKKLSIISALLKEEKSLKGFLVKFFSPEDLDYIKIHKEINEDLKRIAHV